MVPSPNYSPHVTSPKPNTASYKIKEAVRCELRAGIELVKTSTASDALPSPSPTPTSAYQSSYPAVTSAELLRQQRTYPPCARRQDRLSETPIQKWAMVGYRKSLVRPAINNFPN